MTTLPGQSLVRHIENVDMQAVVSLINNSNVHLDERDEDGQTFLMIACRSENDTLEVVRELLKHQETDVNAVDNDNWTALLDATKEGHLEIVEELIEHGANLEHRDMGGWTAITWSCYKGRTEIAKLLLNKGANPNVKGEHQMSCLTWAAGRGHTEIVQLLLAKGGQVNTADKYGTTPLIWASRKGHKEIVDALLDHGAMVDNAGMNSWTALIVASKGGYSDVVEALLEHNPNLNSIDKDGYTALTLAAKDGHSDIVYQLLAKGAYVNIPDRYGDTILIHAVKGGHLEVVVALLRKYADVDVEGVDKKTALYWAVEKSHLLIAKTLLEYNANTEISNKDGDTPLLKAVRNRHLDMLEMLLDKGARVSAVDRKGDTALHIAVRGRSKRVTEVLLRNPKDSRLLYKPNKAGETPYQIDSTHQKSILSQIFGARHLNTEENFQGYDLYSSTIADVLSDPALRTPITVGLYAKWGSGKSFLIHRLRKEMKAFTQHTADPEFEFTWAQFFTSFFVCLILGVFLGLTIQWPVGLGVGLGLISLEYLFLLLIWVGTQYQDWEWADNISMMLAKKLQFFKLLVQVLFCNEPETVNRETAAVKFLFTDNARLASVVGEKSITGMIGTLFDALEDEYGTLVTRLYRVFTPKKAKELGRFKSVCCIPHFVIVLFVFLCLLTGGILIAIYGIHSITDKKYTAVDSVLIAFAIIIGFALLSHIYMWGKVVISLIISPKKRVQKIATQLDMLKAEGFMQRLKKEVEWMGQMTLCMDSFLNSCTRLVVIVDGLDSCEQEKLLQVLDTVHMLFSDQGAPFITILAVDPHVIIKGIEHNLHGLFRDSSINGHDYLRNIVHLPFFLQSQSMPLLKLRERREAQKLETHRPSYSKQDSSGSVLSIPEPGKLKRTKSKRGENFQSSLGLGSSHGGIFRAGSTADLSKTLAKNTYFSDINPRNMRRLMNIIGVTGRLLRAYSIDFNWYRLAAWINITEQWPYRLSWIILEIEDNETIEDSMTLKTVYERVVPKLPVSKEEDPLLEIDRNARKLEVFLANHQPQLNVGDLHKFLPCTINVDPYLRKLIREMQQNMENLGTEHPGSSVVMPNYGDNTRPSAGWGIPSTLRAPSRMDHRATPTRRLFSPFGHQPGMVVTSPHPGMAHPMMPATMPQMPYMMPYFSQPGQQQVSGKTHSKIKVQGGLPQMLLSQMSVADICDVLGRLEGLNHTHLPIYTQTLHDNNISGVVLLHCDLAELRQVVAMTFGDWNMFRALIEVLREKEESLESSESMASPPDGGLKIMVDARDYGEKMEMPKACYPERSPGSASVQADVGTDMADTMVHFSAHEAAAAAAIQKNKDRKKDSAIKGMDKLGMPQITKQDSFVVDVQFETAAINQAMSDMTVEADEETESGDTDEGEDDTLQSNIFSIPEDESPDSTSPKIVIENESYKTSQNQLSVTSAVKQSQSKGFFASTDESMESDMEEVYVGIDEDDKRALFKASRSKPPTLKDIQEKPKPPGILKPAASLSKIPAILSNTNIVEEEKPGSKKSVNVIEMDVLGKDETSYSATMSSSLPSSGMSDLNLLPTVEPQKATATSFSDPFGSVDQEARDISDPNTDHVITNATSMEHIAVRKANNIPDDTSPSAFKAVTPGSSKAPSMAGSMGSHQGSVDSVAEAFDTFMMSEMKKGMPGATAAPAKEGDVIQGVDAKEVIVNVEGKTVKVSLAKDESFI